MGQVQVWVLRAAETARQGRTVDLQYGLSWAAASRHGRLVAISGDAGVGKTRLVEELGLRALAQGGRLLRGRYLRERMRPGRSVASSRPSGRPAPRSRAADGRVYLPRSFGLPRCFSPDHPRADEYEWRFPQ